MKKIKLLIMILLLTGIMIFHTESNKFFLDGKINRSGYFKEYSVYGKERVKFLRDIEKNSGKYNVKYIMVKGKINTDLESYIVYGNKESLNFFKDSIKQKNYIEKYFLNSIFVGAVRFEFKNIKDVVNTDVMKVVMYGSKKDIMNLDSKLIDRYGGGAPVNNGDSKSIEYITVGLYLIYLLIYLVFTLYEVESAKKEVTVKYINGDNLGKLVLKKIGTDIILISGIFAGLLLLFVSKGFLRENLNTIIKLASINILISIIVYLSLLNIDIKKIFSRNFISKKFKIINFTTLIIVSSLFMLISIVNGVNFKNFYSSVKQKELWEKRKSDIYMDFMYKPDESKVDPKFYETEKAMLEFFEKFNKKFNMRFSEFDKDSKTIFLSKGYINLLDEKVELNENKIYILYNDNSSLQGAKAYDNFVRGYKNVYKKINQRKMFIYDKKSTLLSENYAKFNYIIIDNTEDLVFEKFIMGMIFNNYSISIKDKKAYETFIKERDMNKYVFTEEILYDNYKKKFDIEKSVFIFSLITNLLLFIMLWFLVALTIKIEFIENSMKIMIKKLTGSSLLERYRNILLTLGVASGITILGSGLTLIYLNMYVEMIIAIIVSVIYLTIMFFHILRNIVKYEKESINKIIKGGSV